MAAEPLQTHEPDKRWKASQVCLGLFIVWQVVFILGNSLLQMIRDCRDIDDEETVNLISLLTLDLPKEKGPGYQVMKGLHRWAQVTGLEQGWSLFAPGVGEEARFLHTVLCWSDGREPLILLSLTEPDDLKAFFRWGHSRLRKYESYLGAYFYLDENETPAEANQRWQKLIQHRVGRQSEQLPGYLLCRWRAYHEEHPACPLPEQIEMHVVTWQIPPPGSEPWYWQKPVTMPFARIRLQADGSVNGPIQAYNPVSKQFDDLK